MKEQREGKNLCGCVGRKLKRKEGRKRGINRKRKTRLGERKGEELERG